MTQCRLSNILLVLCAICFCLALPPIGCSSVENREHPPILYRWDIELTSSQGVQKTYTVNSCAKPYVAEVGGVTGVWINTRYSTRDWATDEQSITVPDEWAVVISLNEAERSE